MQAMSLKPENAKAWVMLIGGLVAIVVLVVFIQKTFGGISNMISSIGSSLGFSDSPEQAANKAAVAAATNESATTTSPWSPAFFQAAPSGTTILTQEAADAINAQIWDSVGMFSFTTDINEAYGALKECTTQAQVSFLAYRFNIVYNKDLFTWLTLQYTKMGTPDPVLAQMISYVNNLSMY
jgi:hypothetical protein